MGLRVPFGVTKKIVGVVSMRLSIIVVTIPI